jgi:hypothetical protein
MLVCIDFFAGTAPVAGPSMVCRAIDCPGKPEGGLVSAGSGMACEQKRIGDFSGLDESIEFGQNCGKIVFMN